MKTTLDLPAELVAQLKERAARDGRDVAEVAAGLLSVALGGADVHSADLLPKDQALNKTQSADRSLLISIDPETGLPVIHSPPDAPIHRMTTEEMQRIIDQCQLEEDLERAGLAVRH